MVLPEAVTVTDVSVVHPAGETHRQAASVTDGRAAAHRDGVKRRRYGDGNEDVFAFVPLSVETYGRWGRPAMRLLNNMAESAASMGRVSKAGFVSSAQRQLSIALQRGNGVLMRASMNTLAKASGHDFLDGLLNPTAEVDS